MSQLELLGITNLVPELKSIVGSDYVLDDKADLLVYEYDGSIDRGNPVVIVLPQSATEISSVLKLARSHWPERRSNCRARWHRYIHD